MAHLNLRDQDSAEECYKLKLKQIRLIMNDTHRFKRFLNNLAQRHGFRVNELFFKMIILCDTPQPNCKLIKVSLGRTDQYGALSRNRNDVM